MSPRYAAQLFGRGSLRETQRIADALRTETVGGAVLLGAALVAVIWANSPWADSYTALRDAKVGTDWFHLRLSLGHWAADGLLAIFFFVAGLELKREFVVGDLRSPARAALPVAAAFCGVAVPALLYAVITGVWGDGLLRGFAIPTATDIAFALAVLAVLGTNLPSALRSFLLTLAVVDDLIAITIIAVFYTSELSPLPLLLAALPIVVFWLLLRRGITSPWLLVPPAVIAWACVHASGVHATVAGVLLGLLVPVKGAALADHIEHRMRPISAGFAVPVFALFAAGVPVLGGGGGGFGGAVTNAAFWGIVVGLVVGKLVGVFGGTYLFARFTRAQLSSDLEWTDVLGASLLAGIGFTVSLLVADLAFAGTEHAEATRLAVLIGSVAAALLATAVLHPRNRRLSGIPNGGTG